MALTGKLDFKFVKEDREFSDVFREFQKVRNMSFGKERRDSLIKLFQQGLEFYVNCKHSISTEKDPDIKNLLKNSKIELVNERTGKKHKKSFVRLKK